jgi:hypothetical protein
MVCDIYKKRNLACGSISKSRRNRMDSFALCLPTGFPMDVLEIMKREPKFVITSIFRCSIFQILS